MVMNMNAPSNSTRDEDIETRIARLVSRIRQAQQEIEDCNREIQQDKRELRQLLEQYGGNWQDEEGYARLVSEGFQRFYDVDALDRLILTDPLHYGWLKDYRHERVIAERLSVR